MTYLVIDGASPLLLILDGIPAQGDLITLNQVKYRVVFREWEATGAWVFLHVEHLDS